MKDFRHVDAGASRGTAQRIKTMCLPQQMIRVSTLISLDELGAHALIRRAIGFVIGRLESLIFCTPRSIRRHSAVAAKGRLLTGGVDGLR